MVGTGFGQRERGSARDCQGPSAARGRSGERDGRPRSESEEADCVKARAGAACRARGREAVAVYVDRLLPTVQTVNKAVVS